MRNVLLEPSLKWLTAIAVLASTTLLAGCGASLPPARPATSLALHEARGQAIVVVKVKAPWYATRGLITGKFRDAVPEYQAASGLLRKQFSFAEDGAYGGVYLWRERALADEWFGPAWHERVKKKRGVDGDVRIIDLTRGLDGPLEPPVFEGPMVVAIVQDRTTTKGTLDAYVGASGLRAAYEGEGLVVSTWDDREHADAFLRGASGIEWFATPVGLINPP
jgi:hypothetical protein